jgi:predicted esterase
MDVHVVPTITHGRMLVQDARVAARKGLLVGFHGYMETATTQMDRLQAIPGASDWTLVSIQALHRFYRGRSEEVVASWMTREDRELAIADNLAYVAASLDQVPHDRSTRVVYTGFSQGVAMAFRAGVTGGLAASAIVAVGGDIPPELVADRTLRFPAALLARGSRDEWFTQAKYEKDVAALKTRGVALEPLVYDGAHEWNAPVSDAIGEFLSKISRGH